MPAENKVLEKRTNPRAPIKIPVKYRLVEGEGELRTFEGLQKAENYTYTLDVSLEGMYIPLDQPLKAGDVIESNIFLLDKEPCVTIYAEVAWIDDEGAGIHFLLMANEERESLGTFLEKNISGGFKTA